jgi:group I intron endonuclease
MTIICGIYVIECIPTGERYVGSSEDIDRRWSTHRSQLKRQIHHSKLLQARWNEFGATAFRFQVIQVVEASELLAIERRHLLSGIFACNASFPIKNGMKGKKHTPASLALMRKNRAGIPGPVRKGEKRSKEFGEKVSRAKIGRKTGPRNYTRETIRAGDGKNSCRRAGKSFRWPKAFE